MKKLLFILLFCYSFIFSQTEYKYDANNSSLPQWVKEMYSNNPDPGKIELLYKNYYKKNKFIKNKHTQYYKRWKRSLSRKIIKTQANNTAQKNKFKSEVPILESNCE